MQINNGGPLIWEFYTEDEKMNRTVVGTQVCKKPSKTKIYKDLEKQGFSNGIFLYGYRLADVSK